MSSLNKKTQENEQNEMVQPGLDPKRTGKPLQSYPPSNPTDDPKKEKQTGRHEKKQLGR